MYKLSQTARIKFFWSMESVVKRKKKAYNWITIKKFKKLIIMKRVLYEENNCKILIQEFYGALVYLVIISNSQAWQRPWRWQLTLLVQVAGPWEDRYGYAPWACKAINAICRINRIKKKTIISVDAEKVTDKSQHILMAEIPFKRRIESKFVTWKRILLIYLQVISYLMVNNWKLPPKSGTR